MGFQKGYFKAEPGAPPPLRAKVRRRVRFEEVDALGIVWHGRYPSFLEDGRAEFGRIYGLSYSMFKTERIAAPIVQMQIDYRHPLEFDQEFEIETILHWCDALKLTFEYVLTADVHQKGNVTVATASTVQLLTDSDGTLLLTETGFIREFRGRWRRGEL